MINKTLLLLLIILGGIVAYLAGKYHLFGKFFILGKKAILTLTNLGKSSKERVNLSQEEIVIQLDLEKPLNFLKKYLKMIAVIPCGIIMFILVSLIYNQISDSKAKKEGCQPFTPLLLQKYKIASSEKPTLGEKCTLSGKSFLVKLLYENSKQAQNALTGLTAGIVGERETLGDYIWITYKGSSSVFVVDGQKVGVLVLLGIDKEAKVKKELDKVLSNEWIKESGNLTYDSEKESTLPKPTASPKISSETEEILEEARRYVRMHGDVVKFDVKITKKLADYALVQVIPAENIEGAAVILEKIDNRWVAQDMGTIFPEWEEKVPELFKF